MATTAALLVRHAKSREATRVEASSSSSQAFGPNEPRTFRRLYQQDELPVRVVYSGHARRVGWLVDDILALDLQYYVPVFVAAFREQDEPYGFLALHASLDVVTLAGPSRRALTLGPLVNKPLKLALRSKLAAAAERGLLFLRAFVACDAQSVGGNGLAARVLDVEALVSAVQAAAAQHPRLKSLAVTTLTHHLRRSATAPRRRGSRH
ncbi:hypothetical protein CTAYLR_003906 [Chrysophaeum taylorii]|uniref:Uncharacterized protein n=1 Tax=Chrysophaeum taylorii TaxID=2483200 RepID=A0AAD7XLS2_9STRA|nr:hypothetical protein CTAYLR_003906 [Chrysophaeum taylorii]